jgi:uncharacterized protein (DUF2235 family)
MKRLVLCCDGTWNRADQERDHTPCPTNVVKLAYRVAKRSPPPDGRVQIVYYDQGVGTGNALDRLSGGALGKGLEENIHDGYRFLIANYEDGDEIYLFGFSRGAFTARSLAGMIRKCGILRRDVVDRYRDALALYRNEKHPDHPDAVSFRAGNCVCGEKGVKINMMGVWDTVGALGIPIRGLRGLTRHNYVFHDTELSRAVQHAYHALAIDERRAPFEPTLWYYLPKPPQKVEQVWFCGVHSDIGGGYKETGLSDIPLDWMIEKARSAGLAFDEKTMAARKTRPDPLAKLHNSKTGWYRLTPGSDRRIGLPVELKGGTDEEKAEQGGTDPTQKLHRTVLQRWEADPSYRPNALRDYFKRTSEPAIAD